MKKEWYLSLKFIKTFTKSLAVSPQRLKKQAFNKNNLFRKQSLSRVSFETFAPASQDCFIIVQHSMSSITSL